MLGIVAEERDRMTCVELGSVTPAKSKHPLPTFKPVVLPVDPVDPVDPVVPVVYPAKAGQKEFEPTPHPDPAKDEQHESDVMEVIGMRPGHKRGSSR
jgi:hypothetical protein